MRKLLTLALLTFAVPLVFAGGYRVSLQGQKQLAMGHTGVAVVNNAEVLFFNPAGMAFLEDQYNFSIGSNLLVSKTKFQNEIYGWATHTTNEGTPFSAYAAYRVNDRVSIGLAVYTPYGSSVAWDKDWQGSHLVNNIDLQAIYIQPTISFKVNEKFSIGAGPIIVNGSANLNRNLTRSLADEKGNRSDITIDAKGITAWGYTAGILYNPTDKMRVGLSYRSEIVVKARGKEATFHNIPAFLKGVFSDTKFDANFPLPAEISLGLSYQIDKRWLVAVDYNRTLWSVYDALTVKFENSVPSSENPRNFKDSGTYRVGGQYVANEKFTFRAGWYFDESPIRDGYYAPETPRNSSIGFTGGLTYQVNPKFGIDFSFLYLYFSEFNNSYNYYMEDGNLVSFGGDYKSVVFSPGIGLSYGF